MKIHILANRIFSTVLCFALLLVTACSAFTTESTATSSLATELTLYNWIDYLPQSVMDAFTQEYDITINYVYYESQEEAVQNIRAGKKYDLVVLPPELIPGLYNDGYLAPIDYSNVLNFRIFAILPLTPEISILFPSIGGRLDCYIVTIWYIKKSPAGQTYGIRHLTARWGSGRFSAPSFPSH
jgi:hypothetical protein